MDFNFKEIHETIRISKGRIKIGVMVSYGMWGESYKNKKVNMIEKPEIYNEWFNKLRAEIERRRALTE